MVLKQFPKEIIHTAKTEEVRKISSGEGIFDKAHVCKAERHSKST